MKKSRRQEIEEQQKSILAPYACAPQFSKGRIFKEEPDAYRTDFQRDRDRILHTRAFRRLQGKTQVFLIGEGDHYRNRLTHTLEVQQISRDLARSLGLNEDLAESIALAHDLGHTPFAHAGQEVLDKIMREFGKNFEHNVQSRRIVEILESPYPFCTGLNLTREVLDGLGKHVPVYDSSGRIQKINTLEAQVVDIADEIAYYHHDLDDGIRSGILKLVDASRAVYLIRESYEIIFQNYNTKLQQDHFIRRLLKRIIDSLIRDVLEETGRRFKKYKITSYVDVLKAREPIVSFSEDMAPKVKALRRYLYDTLYYSEHVKAQAKEGEKVIQGLFTYYMDNSARLPEHETARLKKGEDKEDVVKDYIAGMTDSFAIQQFQKLYPSKKLKAIQMTLLE